MVSSSGEHVCGLHVLKLNRLSPNTLPIFNQSDNTPLPHWAVKPRTENWIILLTRLEGCSTNLRAKIVKIYPAPPRLGFALKCPPHSCKGKGRAVRHPLRQGAQLWVPCLCRDSPFSSPPHPFRGRSVCPCKAYRFCGMERCAWVVFCVSPGLFCYGCSCEPCTRRAWLCHRDGSSCLESTVGFCVLFCFFDAWRLPLSCAPGNQEPV